MDEPSILEVGRRFRIATHRRIERSTVGPDLRASRGTVIALLDEARVAAAAWEQRYRRDAQVAAHAYQPGAAAEFQRRARDEEERAELLARRIEELGGDPATATASPGGEAPAERWGVLPVPVCGWLDLGTPERLRSFRRRRRRRPPAVASARPPRRRRS